MKELREYRIRIERVPDGESAIDPDLLGLRSKLGGDPQWEQDEEIPECPDCGQEMAFVAQIDSVEHFERHNPLGVDPLSPDQHYMFGDVGLIYVFFCFECLQARSVFQCG
jgi:uncharacterized protein YwqG